MEALCLLAVWLAPHPPFSSVLAPPLRYFFSDRVLHYPVHLWFIYHVTKHTNLIASIVIGAYMSGLACLMVRQAGRGEHISLRSALHSKQVRYARVTLIWLVTWGLARGLVEGLASVAPKSLPVLGLAVLLSVIVQAVLAYGIPSAVFEGLSWWRAMLRGIGQFLTYPLSTLIVVGLPSSLVLAYSFLLTPTRVGGLMQNVPEIALAFVVAKWIIWTAADAMMTVGIAHLWLAHQEAKATATASAALSSGDVQQGPVVT